MAAVKDDYWTPDNINLLVDKRIAKDAVFKQTNSDRLGWLQVVGDMKKDGGSKTLNRINVRKQWFKICELYKKSLDPNEEDIKNDLINTPYYAKLSQFFERNNTHSIKSKYLNQEFRKKLTDRLLRIAPYADRWTVRRTNALIDSRIARNDMFKGRGHAATAWKTITQDVIAFDEPDPETVSVQQVKKKWENLFTKYKAMHQSRTYDATWPFFEKMHHFYTEVYTPRDRKKHIYDISTDEIELGLQVLPDRWPQSRTKLLVERRIARAHMFGRRRSGRGWQAVLDDLINNGAPSNLSMTSVKKKWENLLTRFKILKDANTENPTWPYYALMEKYHSLKKSQKYNNETFDEIDIRDLLPAESVEADDISENEINLDKLTKCRLCQQIPGDYSLVENKELCDRIIEFTSVNIYDNMDFLPSTICEICKTSIEKFYEFLSMCHEVDKELRATLGRVLIKTENHSEDNKTELAPQEEIAVQETLECPECPASFTCSKTLQTHIKSHKASVKYHCEICNIGFLKQSALFAHFKQHFEISKVETVEVENVEIEYLEEKNDMGDNYLDTVNAEDCDVEEEISHIIVSNELYQCELCSKTFTDEKSLKDHFETHSTTEHHCPREDCNKKFTTLNSLRHHEMRHLGINSFLCTSCGKGFVTSNALRMHEKTHSEVKDHICQICSRGFSVLSNLRAHQKKHHEGHRFYCSQCPREFMTKCSLQRHELVHTGVKEFVCDTCSSAFFTLKEMRKHKRYHEGTRLYHCSECFKTFFEKHHLTIHMRCHTGERPYACTISGCNKSFREKQKLQRHQKTPHRLTQPV